MTDMTLQEALAEVKNAPADCTYQAAQVILNAVASGDLIPRADAELAVAEAIRQAGEYVAQTSLSWRFSSPWHGKDFQKELLAAALALAPADALVEVQRLREAVEALVVVLDRNDKKGPIPDVEMMFCWLAAQGVRAAFRKIAQKGEAT